MRNALLFLISLVLAANCVWAVQGLAAWRGGGGKGQGGAGDERLLFQRLNTTTLSVEVGAGPNSSSSKLASLLRLPTGCF